MSVRLDRHRIAMLPAAAVQARDRGFPNDRVMRRGMKDNFMASPF
jgi:hypothetical protein